MQKRKKHSWLGWIYLCFVVFCCTIALLERVYLQTLDLAPKVALPLQLIFGFNAISYVFLIFIGALWFNDSLQRLGISYNQMVSSLVIGTVTFLLVQLHIPERLMLLPSKSNFYSVLNLLPASHEYPTTLNRRIGWFKVESYATDPRGSTYFMIYQTNDFIDTISHGLCYDPTGDCAFPSDFIEYGIAHYKAMSLGDGWYWFSTSNDW
ncbi:MAG: hypothetical protein AAF564_02020 [Bacteroidota bacterium]